MLQIILPVDEVYEVIAQQHVIIMGGIPLYIASDIDLHNHWQHFSVCYQSGVLKYLCMLNILTDNCCWFVIDILLPEDH